MAITQLLGGTLTPENFKKLVGGERTNRSAAQNLPPNSTPSTLPSRTPAAAGGESWVKKIQGRNGTPTRGRKQSPGAGLRK